MGIAVGGTVAEVLDVLDVGVAVAGPGGRLVRVNGALPGLLGLRAADVAPGRAVSALAGDLRARGAHTVAAALAWPPVTHPRQLRLDGGRSVQAAWHRLESGWVLVVRDVTLQAQMRQRLREHNRALAEKVAEKTELVAALCHELRTPLTSTNTVLELLPDTSAQPDLSELLDVVRRNAARIGDVVDELSTLNALEQGSVGLDVRPVDLGALLRGAVAAWNARQGPAAPVTVGVTDPGRLTITADPVWLDALVERLLSVAVASAGDAAVHVSAESSADGWLVRVPLHEQLTSNRLFTATGGARTSTALMLARAVVARHGGTLRMATSEDGGAMELRLPREAPSGLAR
ncbi:histidine kinase dimerization/phospho-acceptor domain-containing protein [Dactylosporangium sp. CA-139114]|uniref:histidine kinase dimerization/phospho-acceptor domain-containing protein n=1 Tax=Dactylosporangium sp. CA-139114 TaxID=3239931 RepID=UPI003D96B8BD